MSHIKKYEINMRIKNKKTYYNEDGDKNEMSSLSKRIYKHDV